MKREIDLAIPKNWTIIVCKLKDTNEINNELSVVCGTKNWMNFKVDMSNYYFNIFSTGDKILY